MNPLVDQHFRNLEAALGQLRSALLEARQDTEKVTRERDTYLRESWKHQKEATTFHSLAEECAHLEKENKDHHATRTQARQTLQALLNHVKTLGAELRR